MDTQGNKKSTVPPASGQAKTGSASQTATAETTEPTTSAITDTDHDEVDGIIKKYTAIAAAAALIPVPAVDLATLAGTQIKMVHSIAGVHGVQIMDNKLKVAIATLTAALPAGTIAAAGASVLKILPGIGNLVGALASPGFFAASTFAIGKIFHAHFASGGTLLNFDPEAMKAEYQAHFTEQAAAN